MTLNFFILPESDFFMIDQLGPHQVTI